MVAFPLTIENGNHMLAYWHMLLPSSCMSGVYQVHKILRYIYFFETQELEATNKIF